MASPAAKSIGFQDAFSHAFRGITTKTDTWNSDLKKLTEATKKMMENAEKSEEVKKILLESISSLNGKNLDEAKGKLVLKSVYLGLPESVSGGEFPIIQAIKKPMADAIAGLKEKAEAFFAAAKISPRSGSSKNMEILASIAAEQHARNDEPSALTRIQSSLRTLNPTALLFTKEVAGEIKLKFAAPVHQKAIDNIEQLAKDVEELNQATSKALAFQDLKNLLNQARGQMQTALDIILDLAQYDELQTQALNKQVQELKTNLTGKVELLSKQMDTLIASEKCEAAMAPLMEPEAKEQMEQFSKTVDLYIQTGTSAVALVNVEKNIQEAEDMLKKAEAQKNTPDLTETQKTIATASKALSLTSTALDVFAEAKAACPKFSNTLLDKLRNAQKKLTEQTKKVVENPELKKAIEAAKSPEVKTIIEAEFTNSNQMIEQSAAAVAKLENPDPLAFQFTDRQKQFFELVNKTIRDESKLEERIRKEISALSQRAIPLMRIVDAGLLSDADSFSITNMLIDYIDILCYIYDKIETGGKTSKDEAGKINDALRTDGIHDLAEFMNKEYYAKCFKTLKPEIEKKIGLELSRQLQSKLILTSKKYDDIAAIWYTERQKTFFEIAKKISDSRLDEDMQQEIHAFSKLAIPLMTIEDPASLSDENSIHIAIMLARYLDVLSHAYDKLDEGYKVSKAEAAKINIALQESGVHSLATFMADEYYGKYFQPLKSKVETTIGSDTWQKFSDKLRGIKQSKMN